nr:hypothetical protein [Bacteroidota bacterium]
TSTDTLFVDFFTLPTTADAGEDQLGLPGSWTTLAANTPETGTGLWTILQGEGGQVTTPNDPNSIFLGQVNEHYILEWQISTACDTARDEVNVAFGFVPFINCGDTLVDTRDMQKYATVQIGDQCWMAENLNVGTRIDGSQEMINNGVIEKYCHSNNTANCDIYGGLYQWNEMMLYSTIAGVQGICPADWHLPTDVEWTVLTDYLGGGSVAGGKMKETGTAHWSSPNTGATNSSGFTALPGGFRHGGGSFSGPGNTGSFWGSTEDSAAGARARALYYNSAAVHRISFSKGCGFSVRCLRD